MNINSVIAYPAAGTSTHSRELSFWKRSPRSNKSGVSGASPVNLQNSREDSKFVLHSSNHDQTSNTATISDSHLLPPFEPTKKSSQSPVPPTKARPKHRPILIPQYLLPLAPDSPNGSISLSPVTPISTASPDKFAIKFDFPNSQRKLSSTSSLEAKPRYEKIKIPAWAEPFTPYDSPESLLSDSSSCTVSSITRKKSPPPSEMVRVTPGTSRTNTLDSTTSAPSSSQLYSDQPRGNSNLYLPHLNGSQSNLFRFNAQDPVTDRESQSRTPASGYQSNPSPSVQPIAGLNTTSSNSGLSGLVCNVHRITGREPRPLVGATTTILGDKLYVFGGRKLSRSKPQLTNDLYELDLIRRHWTKLETTGDKPPARYFHSVCGLGETKLVCYGGMSPALLPSGQPAMPDQPVNPQDPQPEVVAMSDIHIYDVTTKSWMKVNATNSPQGRYAHCAAILPSSSVFSSANAAMSAIHNNPSSPSAPNQGSIGVALDGDGGAEMIVVGGQDSANHYIEQISVFNLRSLTWTTTNPFGRSCGAYRSVTAPLSASATSKLSASNSNSDAMPESERTDSPPDGASALLIYSNYNFLDVRLELQLRLPDGTLIEKPMAASPSPPGLRFPNGGVIDNHFVVSGTFLTSSKQEYALWALDLRKLTWSRIDAGGTTFSQGSWNRGILWSRRNTFVVLGNRKRSLVEDYNHRRINFTNICMIELEAFGLYDNPRKIAPSSNFVSASAKSKELAVDLHAGGRLLSKAAQDLGTMALGLTELCDMEFIAMNGDRIPANSHVVARRWGSYFKQLVAEGMASTDANDTATLRPNISNMRQRQSSRTITPSINSGYSNVSTLVNSTMSADAPNASVFSGIFDPVKNVNPALRPRSLYLPHTTLTLQALLHYIYTSSLPPLNSSLCTPQILCSLLQLARPYRVDGLLEAVVDRLHIVLDNRNTAAIFNAAAMAAGGGESIVFFNRGLEVSGIIGLAPNGDGSVLSNNEDDGGAAGEAAASRLRNLRINTDVRRPDTAMSTSASEDEISSAGTSGGDSGLDGEARARSMTSEAEVWTGSLSSVVGLQKRGLRGLMEGRRMRGDQSSGDGRVGLGIA